MCCVNITCNLPETKCRGGGDIKRLGQKFTKENSEEWRDMSPCCIMNITSWPTKHYIQYLKVEHIKCLKLSFYVEMAEIKQMF